MILNNKDLKKIILFENSSINDAIKSLNKSGLRVVIILNSKQEFLGILQDSDIRRSLIKEYKLQSSITKIINKRPFFIKSFSDLENVPSSDLRYYDHIPIIMNKKVIGLYIHSLEREINISSRVYNDAIIMAGGFGKRLGHLTKKTPKPLLYYKNKTLIEHILEHLKKNNFYNIKISVFYLKKKIKDFFQKNKNFKLNIKFIEEKKALGTIGSLGLLKKISQDFIVLNCDAVTNLDLKNFLHFHKKNKSILTVGIKQFQYKNPYGVIISKNNKFISFKEKPEINFSINAGIYAFNAKIIKIIKKNNLRDIHSLINYLLINNYNISTFHIFENWLDLGQDKNKLSTSIK